MKQADKPLLYLVTLAIGFMIGLYTGDHVGNNIGYARGRLAGYREAIEKFQASTDSLNASYIEARDLYIQKLDSLIIENEK